MVRIHEVTMSLNKQHEIKNRFRKQLYIFGWDEYSKHIKSRDLRFPPHTHTAKKEKINGCIEKGSHTKTQTIAEKSIHKYV